MIHPSYTELIEAINANTEDNDNTMLVNSRYSLVLATSKRARQLIAGAKPRVSGMANQKALSVAIEELYKGKVKILEETPEEEEENTAPVETAEAASEETAETAAEEEGSEDGEEITEA